MCIDYRALSSSDKGQISIAMMVFVQYVMIAAYKQEICLHECSPAKGNRWDVVPQLGKCLGLLPAMGGQGCPWEWQIRVSGRNNG